MKATGSGETLMVSDSKAKAMDVKAADDKLCPCISGCTFMPNGDLFSVICK